MKIRTLVIGVLLAFNTQYTFAAPKPAFASGPKDEFKSVTMPCGKTATTRMTADTNPPMRVATSGVYKKGAK